MTDKRASILYVHNGATTFVRNDQALLAAHYDILELAVVLDRKWAAPFTLLLRFLRALWLMPRVDLVVCQFAGHHALGPIALARLFNKPSMVLSNGSDCVSFPSLGYGHFRKPILAFTTRACFQWCDLIVPLHPSLVHAHPTYHGIDGTAQGITHFCPGLKTPIEPLGYGFDPERWRANGTRNPKRFITVATNAHKPYIQVIKGLDMIMRVAPLFPGHEFLVVGARSGSLPGKPANVVEVPFVPNHELPALYGTATFYLQLSVSEGFGNALCEAMLCGCVPIVSDVGAMPEIVGEAGFVVPQRDVRVLQRVLETAMASIDADAPARARERIVSGLPLSLRAEGLQERTERLLHRSARK
jgi:glycosyltransferase involved in cell wall biosynthesis